MISIDKTHSREYKALNRVSLPKRAFSRIDIPRRVCVRHEIAESEDFSEKNLLISENKVLTLCNGIGLSVNLVVVNKFTNNLQITQLPMQFFRAIRST